jgi:hypothetical protein
MNPSSASTSFRYQQQQQWDTRTDMLASSIMLLSISEGQASHVGYAQRPLSSSSISSNLSGSLGMGMSRQSIKTDLASLGSLTGNDNSIAAVSSSSSSSSITSNNSCNNCYYHHQQSSTVSDSSSSSDDWGFYEFD